MKRAATAVAIVLVLSGVTIRVRAEYIGWALEGVPIDRLIRNLEQLIAKTPNDIRVRFNLARTHAMAFATKREVASVRKDDLSAGPDFGYEPKHVPFTVTPAGNDALRSFATDHLSKAIQRYREVIERDPRHLTARLGYAWCIDQSGAKRDAIDAYRRLIEEAWVQERKLTQADLGWHSVTAEAAGYLIPLLDPDKDRAEIDTLRKRIAQMDQVVRPITPIVIPLSDEASVERMTDRFAHVRFDADGSGVPQHWTWITSDAGWLVYRSDPNRAITSALQWFGNVTFWLFWENGYQAMTALDDNGDGVLNGRELAGLAVWRDANANGVSDDGEVRSLAHHGIVALSTAFERSESASVKAWSRHGVTMAGGKSRATYDLILSPARSRALTEHSSAR